jgi:hypothetical protein
MFRFESFTLALQNIEISNFNTSYSFYPPRRLYDSSMSVIANNTSSRFALITGSSSGIGLATARLLLEDGWSAQLSAELEEVDLPRPSWWVNFLTTEPLKFLPWIAGMGQLRNSWKRFLIQL